MTPFLDDRVLGHLKHVIEQPDLTGTPYEIEREIGRGGMGVVYAAHDSRLSRRVALKIMEGDAPEAALTASLEHPGIVPVYDAGKLADGRSFYAMRLIEGARLDAYMNHPPPLRERLGVFLKICDTLAFAHSRDVVHRDLKPSNIAVGPFGEVLVLDWGLALRPGDSAERPAGTASFMPPEQHAGASGFRSDIFALGRVLDTLLTPNEAKPLAAVAARASADDPSLRYASVRELAAEIERFLDREPVEAYREPIWERARRFASKNGLLLFLIAAYIVSRFAVFFFFDR